mmetsp:Transcript_50217/g.76416  ORF Transcript_50217/g.76416 Transcript_50217/m.76416 type:complete len:237 (-) Transcript_50217:2221-2931(-)
MVVHVLIVLSANFLTERVVLVQFARVEQSQLILVNAFAKTVGQDHKLLVEFLVSYVLLDNFLLALLNAKVVRKGLLHNLRERANVQLVLVVARLIVMEAFVYLVRLELILMVEVIARHVLSGPIQQQGLVNVLNVVLGYKQIQQEQHANLAHQEVILQAMVNANCVLQVLFQQVALIHAQSVNVGSNQTANIVHAHLAQEDHFLILAACVNFVPGIKLLPVVLVTVRTVLPVHRLL